MVQVQQGELKKSGSFRFFSRANVAYSDNICAMKRQVILYGPGIIKFLLSLTIEARIKIEWTLELIRTLDLIPSKYFRHLEGTKGLFEIRVEFAGNIYRLFCFFEKQQTVVIISGFIKKSQKTPRKLIQQAIILKKRYHEEKE